ncbi:MAG: hypothetical protein ABI634_03120 [Acidobacteriota bacterium]
MIETSHPNAALPQTTSASAMAFDAMVKRQFMPGLWRRREPFDRAFAHSPVEG